jgi:signal transduction histidine kinase
MAPSRILVVDDDPAVRESLSEELGTHFAVVSADSGEAALDRLSQEPFDALVSDVRMPGMGGVALLERAAQIDPSLVRVFLTGYADDAVYESAKKSGAYKLRKPWGDELEIILRHAILHRQQLDGMRSEMHSYLTAAGSGAALDASAVTAMRVVQHLFASLKALPWVDHVEVRPADDTAGDVAGPHWFEVLGPSLVPGESGRMEYVTWIGSPGPGRLQVRVQWRRVDDYGQRVVELVLRQAAEALRMRELTDEVRQRSDELESARAEMAQRDRLAALGALAASVTHDLRSPLAVLAANADHLDSFPPDGSPEGRAELRSILEDNRLAIQMIKDVLQSLRMSAEPSSEESRAEVRRAIGVTAGFLRADLVRAGVTLRVSVEGEPLVRVTVGEVCQILMNLIANAAQASPPGGAVHVRAVREGDQVIVEVEDEGRGVPEEERERIFAPFHTTKTTGMGIGLVIARQLARRRGGDLTLRPTPHAQGACFVLQLPAA